MPSPCRGEDLLDQAAVFVLPLGWYAARRAEGHPVAHFRAVLVVALIDVLLLVLSGRVT
jgi:protoheme IX farnesyltransferase